MEARTDTKTFVSMDEREVEKACREYIARVRGSCPENAEVRFEKDFYPGAPVLARVTWEVHGSFEEVK